MTWIKAVENPKKRVSTKAMVCSIEAFGPFRMLCLNHALLIQMHLQNSKNLQLMLVESLMLFLNGSSTLKHP